MNKASQHRLRITKRHTRDGIAAVEFAIVAPILVTIVFGMVQLGRAFEMQTLLDVAAREGARFASIDRTGMTSGQTGNQKLIQDVKNFLASNGLPKDQITVTVKSHSDPTSDFNIDDPANDLLLFDVNVSVPFSAVSLQPVPTSSDYTLRGKVVFRNGRATITQ
jgi:Flp pilus assembly protein TadG